MNFLEDFDVGMIKKNVKVVVKMGREKKSQNIEIGNRLRTIREGRKASQAEFAEALGISDDHYRKIESGSTGLTVDKVCILYEKLEIDPTYLLTGQTLEDYDVSRYLANCSKEQRDEMLIRCMEYIMKYISK